MGCVESHGLCASCFEIGTFDVILCGCFDAFSACAGCRSVSYTQDIDIAFSLYLYGFRSRGLLKMHWLGMFFSKVSVIDIITLLIRY